MIVLHHNKDLDGWTSGAICKYKYPEAKLIGWDYKDPIPDFGQFKGEDLIMIDISFPIDLMLKLRLVVNSLTWIDHHISAKQNFDEALNSQVDDIVELCKSIKYIYQLGKASCELAWEYFFSDKHIPLPVIRKHEGDWQNETLPFEYYMRSIVYSADTFPHTFFNQINVSIYTHVGVNILQYQQVSDLISAQRSSFERDTYGLKAICINTRAFSSDTLASVYDKDKHDIMIGFEYTGDKWCISLRSVSNLVDCSKIASQRGGGGHKNAAGFEVEKFEDIFI